MPDGVQVVNVARELDATIVLELDVRGQPLVPVGPERGVDLAAANPRAFSVALVITPSSAGRLVIWALFGNGLALVSPFVDGVVHADDFVVESLCHAIDERVERRVDEILDLVIGPGMPIRVVFLLVLELGECGAEGIVEGSVDEVVGLDNGGARIQRGNQTRLLEELGLYP